MIKNPHISLTAFPGNIFQKTFKVENVVLAFGRLIDKEGAPLKDTRFQTDSGISYTDQEGYFSIETLVSKEKRLTLLPKGYICTTKLEKSAEESPIQEIGNIQCEPQI